MWFDDMDRGGKGICQPAKGPLGRALRGLRHDLWLSQKQLGDAIGVCQTTVSKIELGQLESWALFCRLIEGVGGRPIVTVERIRTAREVTGDHAPEGGDWW
jgi:DNA-binding XRE family transcriptional regulator